ncbi:MAG: hypothetical protein ACRC3B_13985 [Bacteroidia bacterium]
MNSNSNKNIEAVDNASDSILVIGALLILSGGFLGISMLVNAGAGSLLAGAAGKVYVSIHSEDEVQRTS